MSTAATASAAVSTRAKRSMRNGPARQGPPAAGLCQSSGRLGQGGMRGQRARSLHPRQRPRPGSRCRRTVLAREKGGGGGGTVGGGRVRARARQEVLQVAAQQAQVGVPLHVARAARQAQRLRAPDPAQAGQATGWPAPGGAGVRVGLGHWTHCPSCAGPWTGDRPARAARRWDSHGFPPRCRSAHWQCPETVDTCTRRAPWRARVGRPAARARERAGRRGARLLDRAERGRQVAAAARARGLGGRLPAAQHVECEPKEEVRQRRQAHVRAARAVHQQPPAVLRPALQLGASRSTICLGRGHVAC